MVYPKAKVQLCIVHMMRNSLRYVATKDKKAVSADLKQIYHSPTVPAAEQALDEFADHWSAKYPSIEWSWGNHWDNLITLFDYPGRLEKLSIPPMR